jgi:hypothetical protein
MEVFDRSAALERLDGDADRLEELLEDFQIQIPAVMKAIENAAKRKRAIRIGEVSKELRATAHKIGAEGMETLAGQLVEAAEQEDYEKAGTLLTQMGMELDWLLRILDQNRCSGNL